MVQNQMHKVKATSIVMYAKALTSKKIILGKNWQLFGLCT